MPSKQPQASQMQAPPAGGESRWYESMQGILYVVYGNVQFSDDWDHWRNGFCRLLEIDEEKAKSFVESAVSAAYEKFGQLFASLPAESKLVCLAEAVSRTLYGGTRPELGMPRASMGCDLTGAAADTIYAGTISGNPARIVAGNKLHEFAWLVDSEKAVPVAAGSIVYDTSYFSRGREAHYGPKDYLSHVDWRLEKARRLVATVLEAAGDRRERWLSSGDPMRVLDVGCAIGYFRKAFAEHGFEHFGTEMSGDVAKLSKEKFGFDTWHGGISDVDRFAAGMRFQVITLWDVIEHLPDVVDSVKKLKDFLTGDGILIVRTPNLVAFEADILGDYYYSFKLDHISYFSPGSLTAMMRGTGLSPLYIDTDSHLFKGFLGADYLFKQSQALRGADILAVYAAQSI